MEYIFCVKNEPMGEKAVTRMILCVVREWTRVAKICQRERSQQLESGYILFNSLFWFIFLHIFLHWIDLFDKGTNFKVLYAIYKTNSLFQIAYKKITL